MNKTLIQWQMNDLVLDVDEVVSCSESCEPIMTAVTTANQCAMRVNAYLLWMMMQSED